jgi:hypothetical protein
MNKGGWDMQDVQFAEIIDGFTQGVSAVSRREEAYKKYQTYSPLYAFTTENLSGYLPKVSRAKMEVLCVAASGDHLLNALYLGASSLTAFDVNRLAFAWTTLKLVACKQLSYQAFLQFFLRDQTEEAFSYRQYVLLRMRLPYWIRNFFDVLYDRFDNDGLRVRTSEIFRQRYYSDSAAIRYNPYLQSEENYSLVKQRVSSTPIRFLHSCASTLSTHLGLQAFDLILLSNIADYLGELYPEITAGEKQLTAFSRSVLLPLREHLNANGLMCAAYVYCIDQSGCESKQKRSIIDYPVARRKAFAVLCLEMIEHKFSGVNAEDRDLVTVLRCVEKRGE